MQRTVTTAATGIALAIVFLQAAIEPAAAQRATTSAPVSARIDIKYEPIEDARQAGLQVVRERLMARRVLERLQAFLEPLKLKRDLAIRTADCGDRYYVPYRSGGPVTICYQYAELIEQASRLIDMPGMEVGSIGTVLVRKEWTLVGPFVQEALRDVALAVFDIDEIPVWGGTENAADYTAAFLMLQFGSDVAWKTILGSAYFLAVLNDNVVRRGYSFAYLADIRPTLAQRYYNMLCIAVGSDWVKFGMFLPVGREEKITDLPVRRLGNCTSDYQVLHRAFVKTIVGPYVDPELQKKVLATNWIE
jgi:hypothetical protein